jgi:hypothetical protein
VRKTYIEGKQKQNTARDGKVDDTAISKMHLQV